jgi:hypothetical protein
VLIIIIVVVVVAQFTPTPVKYEILKYPTYTQTKGSLGNAVGIVIMLRAELS